MKVASETADRGLTPFAVSGLRVLSRHPGTPVIVVAEVVEVALGTSPGEAVRLLDELVAADLVRVDTGGDGTVDRYVVVAEALERARAEDRVEVAEEVRHETVSRLIDWYLRGAVRADLAVNGYRKRFGPLYGRFGTGMLAGEWSGVSAGLDWLEAERHNLRACVEYAGARSWHAMAWQLCEALWGLYVTRRHYADWVATHTVGLDAARALGEPGPQYQMATALAYAYTEQREFAHAQPVLEQALRAARATRLHVHEGAALEALGLARLQAGEYATAITYLIQARALYTVIDSAHGMARASYEIGRARVWLGAYGGAVAQFRSAYDLFGRVGDVTDQGRVLISTGEALILAGQAVDARRPLTQARGILGGQGRRFHEAVALDLLGSVAQTCGDLGEARSCMTAAIDGYVRTGSSRAAQLRTRLAELG